MEEKAITNLDSILKSRGITLPVKVPLIKAMVFPVIMYRCESWTIKKAECWRIDAFELWCWRLLRVPWTSRRSNQSILKKISPEYSLEGLMLKLKLQYFGHLMQGADLFEKTNLDAGEDWGQEEKGMTEDEMVGWYHQLLEFTQTHVHRVSNAIQPSNPLSSPSPPDLNLPQHQAIFKWVSSLHQVAKILELQLQHQSFQWTLRTDLL